jgi:aspartate/methionine/tyrosine aminotransferase
MNIKNSDEEHKFSLRGRALVGQEMFKVLDRARSLEEAGNYIYHLELGNPRFPPPREVIDATVDALREFNVGYTSSAGLPELRQILAEKVKQESGRNITKDNFVISPANLIINQFLDLTCNPGDRVAIFTPAFPTYYAAIAHIGLETIEVPLNPESGFDLNEKDVEKALAKSPKAILLNSPNNPTGAIYSKGVIEYLAMRCNAEGVWLLSDETYAEACYNKQFNSLVASDYPLLVVMSSFSKIFSIPGYRTGYAIAYPDVAEKFALSNSTLISCLPPFTQLGCVAGVNVMNTFTETVRKHFGELITICLQIIDEAELFPHSNPVAGFYIFINIEKTGLDDVNFCKQLLDHHHTAVTPGRSFGLNYSNYIRIAVCGKRDDVINGTKKVVAFAKQLIDKKT